jgi:serine/threonine-protein kinase
MGFVLSAQHVELETLVAVKLMSAAATIDPDHLVRFKREAKAAANIKSERVVKILDFGTLEDRTPFIVMEQLEGVSLCDLLEEGKRIEIADAVDYVIQACEGLFEAHKLGVIHRDIKPGNLFLVRRDGAPLVKVLDFGAAKVTRDSRFAGDGGSTTSPASLIGSPRYMAPEQLRETAHLDSRIDVYALGASLYELLSGEPIFDGETVAQIFTRVLYEPPPPIARFRPDLPPGLEGVVTKALQKEPELRYQSVVELAAALLPFAPSRSAPIVDALARAKEGAPLVSVPPRSTSPSDPSIARYSQADRESRANGSNAPRKVPFRLAIALTLVAVALGVAWIFARPSSPSKSTPTIAERVPVATARANVDAPSPEPPPTLIPAAVETAAVVTATAPLASTAPPSKPRPRVSTAGGAPPGPSAGPLPGVQAPRSAAPAASGKGQDFSDFGGRL